MKAFYTQHLVLGFTKNILAIVFLFAGTLSYAQTTYNFNDLGGADYNLSLGSTPFTYQDFKFTTNGGIDDGMDYWPNYGESISGGIALVSSNAGDITVLTVKRTDSQSFSFKGIWLNNDIGNASITIKGYLGGNPTGDQEAFSISSEITTAYDWVVDEIRIEGADLCFFFDNFKFGSAVINSPPTATAPSAPTVTEDDTNVALANDIQVADTDGDNQTVTFTITGGTLTIGTTGITFGGSGNGNASFTAAGTLAAINTALDAATFTPTPNLSGTNAGTISFTTHDGTVASSAASVTFSITAINDDPSISGLPTDITVTEDVASNVDLSAATLSDVDAGANSIVLTIEASVGTLTAGSGGSVTIGGSGTGTLSLTGTVPNINTYLNTSTNIKYTSASNVNGNDAATLTLTANDGGNTGTGGGANVALGTVNVDITAINDDPSISGLPTDITVTEDVASNVDLSASTLSDVDAGANSIVLTIEASVGTLTAGSGGSVTIGGSGTGALSLTGTVANINTYLNTSTNIKYTGVSNVNGNDAATITLTANDGGNTGTGGGANVALGTVNVDITAVNDKPTASSFTTSTIYENTPYAFATANFGYSDGDGDPLDHVRITAVPTNGALWVDSDGSGTVNGAESALSNNGTISKAILDVGYFKYLNTNGTSSSFTFDVNDGTDYSASTYIATLTVTPEPTVTLSLDPFSSISENAGSTSVKATLSNTFNKAVSVNLLKSGTTSETDYSLSSTSIAITIGNTTGTATITGVNDDLDEDNETVIIDISSVTNGTELGTQQQTVTITDDDISPTVAFYANSSNGSEALGSADLQVDLSAASGLTVSVDYTVTGTASGSGIDYSLADGTLTIAAGSVNDNITIASIVNDLLDENNETVIVTLSNPTNASLGTNTVHTYTIIDNDATPTVAFNAISSNGSEALGSADLQVDLSAVSGRDVTVDYTVTGTASGNGTDYTLADGTLTISAGSVNHNINIASIVNDLLDENNETVIVTLSNPTNASLGTNTVHTYTIIDNDATPTVAFNAISSNGSEALGSADLQVDLSAVSGRDVTVDYTVTGTASGNGTDYTLADGTLTISAGAVNYNINIASIVNDLLDENNETVIVTLSNPTNASLGTNTVHTYTIIDNDATPTVAFNAISSNGSEALGNADLQVDLSAVSGLTVTVNYSVNGNTASDGIDFIPASGTLIFAAGDVNDNITIAGIVNDLLNENNETVIVTLSNPTNATLGTNTIYTYTIIDNDAAPLVAFNSTSSDGVESVSSADLQVDLSAASGLAVTVDYVVTGTAMGSGTDFTLADGTLSINAGDVSNNITIASIVDDLMDENNETVIVTLLNPVNATLGSNTVHTYTINDNDNDPVVTTSQSFSIAENIPNSGAVGAVLATDGDIGTSFSAWTETGGTGASIFEINVSSGAITVTDNSGIDYETTTSYTYTVTVSDGTNTSASETITINITDVNDVAPIVTASQTFNIDEDASNTTSVGTVLAIDADAIATTFSSWTITSGNTNGVFAINSSTGEITVNDANELDYESIPSYSLSITVSDGINTSVSEMISINVTDVNDVAPIVTASQTFNIDEDTSNTTSVGTVLAIDADATATVFSSWTIISGNDDAIFGINGSSGEIIIVDNSNLDFETIKTYTLGITVSDGSNTSVFEDVIIYINDVNDNGPVLTDSQIFTIDENLHNGNIFGTVKATDIDSNLEDLKDWTITNGNDNNAFTMNSLNGQITVSNSLALDRETTDKFLLEITVSDGELVSEKGIITIQLNDLNDNRPVVTMNQIFSVNENSVNGTIIGNIEVTDADVTGTIYRNWTITNFVDLDGNGNNGISIHPDTGELSVNDPLDFDYETTKSFSLMIKVSDGTDFGLEEEILINIGNLNDNVPSISANQSFSVNENAVNSTSVGTVLASDGDSGTNFSTWTITGGNDDAIFEINSNSGVITISDNTNLDFETTTSYILSVTVSDGVNSSAVEDIVITIMDANEAPTAIQLSNATIAENLAIGSQVGTLTASDEDANQILTFTMAENEFFALDGDKLVSKLEFNYEANNSYSAEITVVDQDGLSYKQSFNIQISDANESPTSIQLSNTLFLENTIIGTEVGTLTASDIDSDQTFIYTIEENENFEIAGDKLVSKAIFDYESQISYLIQVAVTDQSGLNYKQSFIIQIENRNEAPRFISEPIVDAQLSEMYTYTIEYQDVDSDGCTLTALEMPSWLILEDNEDGTASLFGIPSEAGAFKVVLEASDNEYTTSQEFDIVVATVTAIEDFTIEPIVRIYPNPVVHELHIDLSDFRNDETTISLFSMTGSLIFKEEHKNIGGEVRIIKSVQQLRSGVYFLVIESEGYRKSYKIVKQ